MAFPCLSLDSYIEISMKEQTVDFERRSQSDCVHEQVAKADCECPLCKVKEET